MRPFVSPARQPGAEEIPACRTERASRWSGIQARDFQRLVGRTVTDEETVPGRIYVWLAYCADGEGRLRRIWTFAGREAASEYAREMGLRLYLTRVPVYGAKRAFRLTGSPRRR